MAREATRRAELRRRFEEARPARQRAHEELRAHSEAEAGVAALAEQKGYFLEFGEDNGRRRYRLANVEGLTGGSEPWAYAGKPDTYGMTLNQARDWLAHHARPASF